MSGFRSPIVVRCVCGCVGVQVALYCFFWYTRHIYGWSHSLICQTQYSSTGIPLLAAFISLFAALLASATCFRRSTARTAVQSIPLDGSEDVVLFPARRGLLGAALARRLGAQGHVTCVDQWSLTPNSDSGTPLQLVWRCVGVWVCAPSLDVPSPTCRGLVHGELAA